MTRNASRKRRTYVAESRADGTILVYPTWDRPKECPPADLMVKDPYWCPVCECPHIGGVLERLALADAIARKLNGRQATPPERGEVKR